MLQCYNHQLQKRSQYKDLIPDCAKEQEAGSTTVNQAARQRNQGSQPPSSSQDNVGSLPTSCLHPPSWLQSGCHSPKHRDTNVAVKGGSTSYCGSFFVVVEEEETFPRRFPADSHSVPLTRITAHVPVLYERRMSKDLILSALLVRGELRYRRAEPRRFSNCWVCGW